MTMSSRAATLVRNTVTVRPVYGYVALVFVLFVAWATHSLHVGALAVIPLVCITLATSLRSALVTSAVAGIVIALIDRGAVPGGNYLALPMAADAVFLAFSLTVVAYVVNTLSRTAIRLESLESRARRDPLTGISNRGYFMEQLRAAAGSLREGERIAVLFADLDRFKEVNDSAGHTAGDKVLALVARRMQHAIRAEDFVSRIGGDEFAMLIRGVKNRSEVQRIVGTIASTFSEPFVVGNHIFNVGVTIGTSFAPDDGIDAEQLLAAADADMYRLKQERHVVPVVRGST